MHVVRITAFGAPDQLTFSEVDDLVAGKDQVIVEVEAIGVGLVDVLKRRGALGGMPGLVPGSEVAGRIMSLGPDVAPSLLGQRVYVQSSGGGYADQLTAGTDSLVYLPDAVTAQEAVALGVNALVAFFSQQLGRLATGERVLIRGASGGIGLASVQMAAALGAEVTAITNSNNAAAIEELGAQHIVCRDRNETPAGEFDVIMDPVGGKDVGEFIGMLKTYGRYVLVGAAAGFPDPDFGKAILAAFPKSPTFSVFSMASVSNEQVKEAFSHVFTMAKRSAIKPIISQIFPLAEANRAHEAIEDGTFGKIILHP
ncbi:quinone oxidoreductase family protein [Rahnella sikkimica]|uniref:Enoyl reductase (ER) domain-containing protein n=1 Tax=Rahnella sikkimica TaxID=1805933 RepID=A0A2L1UYR0_9GAMM|nr:zinc-binding dehydrogenase [Rahnella sikkimica]AVF37988.1 hypothetical protein BV494_24035 [Rahnella sikkimica]